ncbi:glycoside hydrolase family 38 C-terminal domain-containing protein, partial [Cohnella sp. GbtcB17]|uniref:glycoside hydrolase family 38 C-terminal domain-containing protein n=1 Tax=Cohnella sp. GbtcB17 TaxID=2824762 RepID=UPI0027D2D40F
MRNQFHDLIPGSSIGAVYQDARGEYAEAERLGKEAIRTAADRLAGQADGAVVTIYNSAAFDRTELVEIPVQDGIGSQGAWLSEAGRPLRSECDGSRWLVLAEAVPAAGAATLRFDPSAEPPAAVKAFEWSDGVLRTPHYELAFDEAGRLVRLYDRDLSREVLPQGARANELQVFEDKPKMYEAWDIDLFYQEKQREVTNLRKLELVECGSLRAVLRFEWAYGASVVEQRLVVYAHDRRIDFVTRADWHERQQLLKVAFPVEIRATEATYDIQFGNVKRPTHWNTSWDHARFETV